MECPLREDPGGFAEAVLFINSLTSIGSNVLAQLQDYTHATNK